jgi:hypothetical protein
VAVVTPELAEQSRPEVEEHQSESATWLAVGSPAAGGRKRCKDWTPRHRCTAFHCAATRSYRPSSVP